MTLQNRVSPFGELVADPARGLVYGNRGCLHDETGRIRRRYDGKRWIACRLAFRGWHREPLMQPGRFTELFFLDEATAFAAGHRPCALCRHSDYMRFVDAWRAMHPGETTADRIDRRLHAERIDTQTRSQRRHETSFDQIPDGTSVAVDRAAFVMWGRELWRWTPGGYVERRPVPSGVASVLTPLSLVEVLRRGWDPEVPLLHPSARATARTAGFRSATVREARDAGERERQQEPRCADRECRTE